MNEKPENPSEEEPPAAANPVIPPPDLPKPPPPTGGPAVNVRIRPPAEAGALALPAEGIATFNSRAAAVMIDLVVCLGLVIAAAVLLRSPRIGMLAGYAYLLTRDSLPFLRGQSIGKKAMKIQAVDLAGNSLAGNWQSGAIRNISLVIPFVPIIELFILLTREDGPKRGRRLGDEWAQTKVVVVPDPPAGDEAGG